MWERKMVLGKEDIGDGDNDKREEINTMYIDIDIDR